jgi:DNA-binding transcriptional ArsR family regulator
MGELMDIAILEPILGSINAERVLVYLVARGEGYGREIARFFGADPVSIQKQLVTLERGGVLTSREVGRTVTYQFNPRYAFLPELNELLAKALSFYPEEERERFLMSRQSEVSGE